MKRVLEVEGEVEKLLHSVLDAALKAGGMQMHGIVNQLIAAIKQVEEKE
jgi:hypothetical protein